MDTLQTRATLAVALMAAFADGLNDERERAAVKQLADSFGSEAGIDLPGLYREVLLEKPAVSEVVGPLTTPESRQFAYEMAVGVANADGAQNEAEGEFLARLAAALQIPAGTAGATNAAAMSVANAAIEPEPPRASASDSSATTPHTGTVLGKASLSQADMDQLIHKASITNAALEVLPESIATMAIIPLQMRLVYRIGKSYGYEMNTSHAKEFLATLGVGLTSQYIEQFGRKLLGGLLGTLAGGLGRGLGRQAASSGMSFATTYALGRVAERYYASGRTLDTDMLKQTFEALLAEARGMAPQYQNQIQDAARSIDTRRLASLVRQL